MITNLREIRRWCNQQIKSFSKWKKDPIYLLTMNALMFLSKRCQTRILTNLIGKCRPYFDGTFCHFTGRYKRICGISMKTIFRNFIVIIMFDGAIHAMIIFTNDGKYFIIPFCFAHDNNMTFALHAQRKNFENFTSIRLNTYVILIQQKRVEDNNIEKCISVPFQWQYNEKQRRRRRRRFKWNYCTASKSSVIFFSLSSLIIIAKLSVYLCYAHSRRKLNNHINKNHIQ